MRRLVAYCFLTPHLLSFSTHTPPAFSQSALFFASRIPAKAGAVNAIATVKAISANKSLFMVMLLTENSRRTITGYFFVSSL